MPYNPETEQFYQNSATIVDSTPDGDSVKDGFKDRLSPALTEVYQDMNLLKTTGMIGVGIPATTTTRGIGRSATTVEVSSGVTGANGPAWVTPESKAFFPFVLCEFYYFRHPTLKPGFQPAKGGLLANAATLYPEAWAYLQTTEGKKLCKTEAEWQALTTKPYCTLTNGTKFSFNGIGGAPFYAPNTATGALRLPDLRGMYAEAAGFDGLEEGGVHLDGIRNITGEAPSLRAAGSDGGASDPASGVLRYITVGSSVQLSPGTSRNMGVGINTSFTLPTAAKNQPRAFGVLACVYLGAPR